MKELYEKLRMLIADNFKIKIADRNFRGYAIVTISPCNGEFPWTRFEGKTMEHALERAIRKLENPNEDYIELDGHVWKADESSCFCAEHIKGFLKKKEVES